MKCPAIDCGTKSEKIEVYKDIQLYECKTGHRFGFTAEEFVNESFLSIEERKKVA